MVRRKARLFLGNLPQHVSQDDVHQKLKRFASVSSVEIKQKKEIDQKTVASTFAFVDIEAEESTIQQCLRELRNREWDGSYIKAEVAKESFLERLQRERDEASKTASSVNSQQKQDFPKYPIFSPAPLAAKEDHIIRKRKTVFEEESDLGNEKEIVSKLESFSDFWKDDLPARPDRPLNEERIRNLDSEHSLKPWQGKEKRISMQKDEESSDKFMRNSDSLRIKSQNLHFKEEFQDVGKDPAAQASEMKRLKALEEKNKSLTEQRNAIKLALSSIDIVKPSKKVIFDDDGEPMTSISSEQPRVVSNKHGKRGVNTYVKNSANGKNQLFDEDDENDHWHGDFSIKKQFDGKKGKQLLEMQARFKDDERFVIDERFYESDDDNNEKDDKISQNVGTEEEKELQEEKAKEMEILASVLGEPVQRSVSKKSVFNPMVRFDPLKPNHAKFELPKQNDNKLKSIDIDKKKLGKTGGEEGQEEEVEPLPVDEKQFYQIASNIKELFKKDEKQKNQSDEPTTFSLRQMFAPSKEDNEPEEEKEVARVTPVDKRQTKPKPVSRPMLRGFQGSKPLAMFSKKVLRPELDGVTNTFCKDVDVEAITKKFSEKRRLLGRMIHKKRVTLERQQHFKQKIGVASANKSFQRDSALRRKTSKPWEKRRGKR